MKVNELMIGDRVMHTDKQLYIAGIYGERVYDDDNNVYRIESITPIPLTIEILKKNGWNGDYSSTYPLFDGFQDDGDGYLEISVFEDGEIRATINLCEYDLFPIKYVHELQHALRLCGLNDLADNFKV